MLQLFIVPLFIVAAFGEKKSMASYKYCIVPMCETTSIKEPNKIFVHVPKDEKRRKKWSHLMKRSTPISPKTTCYVCEDHFDMLNDIENYMEVKMLGVKVRPKLSAVPHIFNCQKKHLAPKRLLSENRKRKSFVYEILRKEQSTSALTSSTDMDQIVDMDVDENQQSTSVLVPTIKNEYILEPVNETSFKNKGVQARCHFRSKSTQVSLKEPIVQGSKFAAPVQPPAGVSNSVEGNSTSEKQKTIPVESVVVVKKEPADPTPSTSNNTDKEEFILPHPQSSWTTPDSRLSVDNEPVVSDGGQLKKKQRTDSSASTSVSDSSVVLNHTVLSRSISNISSSSNHCKNQFEGFGNYVADKLNCLDAQSALRAQKAIESILLEAEMGKYLDETQDIKPSIVPF